MGGGLTRRMALASGALALVLGAAFVVLLLAIVDLRAHTQSRSQTREELQQADALEKLVIDLETGMRGFVITRDPRFLGPWREAQAALPRQTRAFESLVSGDPVEEAQARRLVAAITSYVHTYSIPLVNAVRRNEPSAHSVERTEQGKVLVDALRAAFDAFRERARADLAVREAAAADAGQRAVVGAGIGLVASIALIAAFLTYVTRALVRPVRRAASMADRLAGGDLRTRMPESGPGEIAALERSFNVMADSLERDRGELAASRARIVATADETRRRIERDLHDGAQQRLVALTLELRAAEALLPAELGEVRAELSQIAEGLAGVLDDLRELARGLHPAVLAEGGLRPALRALARRSPIPVELAVQVEGRLPQGVEVAAYFVVAEALTNAAKHAQASVVEVDVEAVEGALRISVADDGVGGADQGRGTGLIGLRDRVQTAGGTMRLESPAGAGTRLLVELPVPGVAPRPSP